MSLNSQIADLILERGRAQAQGDMASGAAWGGALSQIGQNVGRTIAALPAIKAEAARVGDEQRARDARLALSDAMKPTNVPPVEQDGLKLYNVKGMADFMSSKGFGAEFVPAAEHLDVVNKSLQGFQQARMDVLRSGALALAQTGGDPTLTVDYLEHLKANQIYDSATIQDWQDKIKDNPEFAKSVVTYLAGPQKLQKVGANESLVSPANPTAPIFTGPPKPGEGNQVINGQMVSPTGEQIGAPVPKQATPLAPEEADLKKSQLKEIEAKLAGTMPMSPKDKAELEIQRGRLAEEIKRDAAQYPLSIGGGAAGSPDASANPTGDDVLKRLAPPIAQQVKALAEGRMAFPGGFALKSPYWQSMLSLVGQYDPSFDATNFNNRAKTRADFSSGKSAQTINALNTVAQHLDRLSTSADALNNSSLPAYNSIANLLSKASGNPVVTKFETDKKAVVDELTRAWRQSGGTESDIKSWSSVLDAAGSPAQLHTAIGEMGALLEGKLSAMETQLQQGMGKATDLKAITPEAKSTLDKLQGKAAPTADASVPSNVASALKGASVGKHTLSDGSVWIIGPDGTVKKGS